MVKCRGGNNKLLLSPEWSYSGTGDQLQQESASETAWYDAMPQLRCCMFYFKGHGNSEEAGVGSFDKRSHSNQVCNF